MKTMIRGWALIPLTLSVAAQPASAGSWYDSPLGRAKFGAVWSGEKFKTSDLAGKVVLVKSWAHW